MYIRTSEREAWRADTLSTRERNIDTCIVIRGVWSAWYNEWLGSQADVTESLIKVLNNSGGRTKTKRERRHFQHVLLFSVNQQPLHVPT